MWYFPIAVALLGTPGGDEVAVDALVGQLAAPAYAEREAASRSLQRMGPSALPALRQAQRNADAEVRNRATVLAEHIETSMMLEPTRIPLPSAGMTLREALTAIERTAHTRLIVDGGTDHPDLNSLTLSSHDGDPTFWEAVTQIEDAHSLQLAAPDDNEAGSNALALVPVTSDSERLQWTNGPFLAQVTGISTHRERRFEPLPPHLQDGRRYEQFRAQLRIRAEPRMLIRQDGPIRILEAADDSGRSLLPEPIPAQDYGDHSDVLFGGAGSQFETEVEIRSPDRSAQVLRRLRAVLPLRVAQRRPDPLVIDLSDARGKTFHNAAVNIEVVDYRPSDPDGQSTVELVISHAAPTGASARTAQVDDTSDAEAWGGPLEHQIEFTDDAATAFRYLPIEMTQLDGQLRVRLVVLPGAAARPPSQLRFFGLVRARIEVALDFKNIPLP